MRPFARAAALVVVTALASPGCIVAIGTPVEHDEGNEDSEELHEHEQNDADEAYKDKRILQLEERMNRLEQSLAK